MSVPLLKCPDFVNTLSFCILCVLLILPETVRSQCDTGYEVSCAWSHDGRSALRWIPKTESGETFVQLSDCNFPDCGIGVIQSPWLPPRAAESVFHLPYKIYGTSSVYLRLYLKTEDNGQHQLFSKTGNYGRTFPKTWSTGEVVIPRIDVRHRLLLKAHIPYKEAYVAVGGINLDGNIPFTTTETPSTTKKIDISLYATEFSQDDESEENAIDSDEHERKDEFNRLQALEVNFLAVDELKLGYTRVMEPNICKYK